MVRRQLQTQMRSPTHLHSIFTYLLDTNADEWCASVCIGHGNGDAASDWMGKMPVKYRRDRLCSFLFSSHCALCSVRCCSMRQSSHSYFYFAFRYAENGISILFYIVLACAAKRFCVQAQRWALSAVQRRRSKRAITRGTVISLNFY